MADNFTILVGTIGQGMNVSGDSGETWTKIRNPIPSESNIRALRTYPDDPHRILAGSDGLGLFRSDDNGVNWETVDSPIGESTVSQLTPLSSLRKSPRPSEPARIRCGSSG